MSSLRARPRPTLRSWATGARGGAGSCLGRESGEAPEARSGVLGRAVPSDTGERGQALTPRFGASSPRWAKGGFLIEDAHESRYETNVDYSFFTEPVSCEVHNKVGSTNVSTLVNVHCE